VLQVKTMSSHHCEAATRQWKSKVSSSGNASMTRNEIASPQSGHEVSIEPFTWSAAQMPIASQAQLANHDLPPARTRYAVGTAENGLAILISSVC